MRSRFPFQKKLKARVFSSLRTHASMCTSKGTYQTRESASALITRALPWKESWHCLTQARTFSTAVMRGLQLATSRLPTPMKTLRTLILADDQSRLTGGSWRPFHKLNQRPLDWEIQFRTSTSLRDGASLECSFDGIIRSDNNIEMSSVYWEIGSSGSWTPGREGHKF